MHGVMATPPFVYQEMFPMGEDTTKYRLLTKDYVSVSEFEGKPILKVEAEGLRLLAETAWHDVAFYLRPEHLKMVQDILLDPTSSENDKSVALTMLRNAEVAAQGVLPLCQDTGTAICLGKKGQQVWTGYNDAEYISRGAYDCYTKNNLRYSQNVALDMYKEINTRTNLPAQIDLFATDHGMEYDFLFIAKGGGSANKTYLYQETKALLNPSSLKKFMVEKMSTLGTAACPPYHVAFVVGGTSAETCLKTVKLASTKYYDSLPTSGNEHGRAFRDVELENELKLEAEKLGLGAQFGGKAFALDVRVVRLPRHGASCPVALGVSCSADRNAKAKITPEGIFIEELEYDPGKYIPAEYRETKSEGVPIDLDRPMNEVLAELTKYPVKTRLSLTGTIIVGRDIAHAKLKELLDAGKELPQYIKDHPIYYAGPAKTPEGYPSGSFGPTTAGRMDSYVELFQSHGGSMIMIAKGNRAQCVTDSCKQFGGFYLGSIGGVAADLAKNCITSIECIEYPELGMEAIWKITVKDFPAYILVDDKGNDFFADIRANWACPACAH